MLRSVKKKLNMALFPMGFHSAGNCYYYIRNDLAFCLSFDQPSGMLYSTFHMIPLYVPCEGRYYTYGNRLNDFPGCPLETLTKTASDQEIDVWVDNLQSALKSFVFPFFQSVDTPEQLLRFINGDIAAVRPFFHCPPDQLDRLRVFTCLRLNDYDNLRRAIKQAYDSLSRASYYIDRVKEERICELSKMEELLSDPDFSGGQFCAGIVAQTTKRCFGNGSTKGSFIL